MQGRDRVQKFKAIFFLLFLIFVTRAGTLLFLKKTKGDNMVKTEKRYSNFAKDFFCFLFKTYSRVNRSFIINNPSI